MNNTSTILSTAGDSRLKNLENIYMKPVPQRNARNNINISAFQGRYVTGAANTTSSGTAFDKDKWANRSDSEERVNNEVAKMQNILEKEAKLKKKGTGGKQILDGGWI